MMRRAVHAVHRCTVRRATGAILVDEGRDTKVAELQARIADTILWAVVEDKDVARLEIAMDEALAVNVLEAVENLQEDAQILGLVDGSRRLVEPRVERELAQLHLNVQADEAVDLGRVRGIERALVVGTPQLAVPLRRRVVRVALLPALAVADDAGCVVGARGRDRRAGWVGVARLATRRQCLKFDPCAVVANNVDVFQACKKSDTDE